MVPPGTSYPRTAIPYRPSVRSDRSIFSDESDEVDFAISSSLLKSPSPFWSLKRYRSISESSDREFSEATSISIDNDLELFSVMFLHHEADILFLPSSRAVSLGRNMGWDHPYDVTLSTKSGTVDTRCTASTPLPSFQSETTFSKPDRSAAIYPTDMFRGLSFEPTPCRAVCNANWCTPGVTGTVNTSREVPVYVPQL